GAAHAEVGRELLLRPAPSLEQQAVGVGKLDWIEIGAVKVLDDRDLEELLVGKIENASGNGGESDLARRAQTAFAENELVSAAALSHHERLKDAVAAERGLEGRHVLGRELAARLIGVRIDEGRVDRMEREGARVGLGRAVARRLASRGGLGRLRPAGARGARWSFRGALWALGRPGGGGGCPLLGCLGGGWSGRRARRSPTS